VHIPLVLPPPTQCRSGASLSSESQRRVHADSMMFVVTGREFKCRSVTSSFHILGGVCRAFTFWLADR
jgi:hypothetical protein